LVISNPSIWKELNNAKGDKYDKILEIIAALNILEGSEDHGALSGLADDDHTQYPLETEVNAALMIGAANSAWIPCCFQRVNDSADINDHQTIFRGSAASADALLGFLCPLPTNRGGKKLYVKGIRIQLQAADADDYIDDVSLRGITATGAATVQTDTTNRTAPGEYIASFTAEDMSAYKAALAMTTWAMNTANQLGLMGMQLDCYYDT
jgi:hypothetical protein